MQFGQKHSIKQLWFSWPVILLLGVTCALLIPSVYKRFVVEREMSARAETAIKEKEKILSHKEDLEEKVKYLAGERGVEEEIRRNFDVARNGEEVVILTGDPKPPEEAPKVEEENHPWWQFWR